MHGGGAEALVLAILAAHRMAGQHGQASLARDDVRGVPLVLRIPVAMQKRHHDNFRSQVLQLVGSTHHVGNAQRFDDGAVGAYALAHFQPPLTRDQDRRFLEEEVVEIAPLVTPDFQNVPKPACRDHPQPCRRALEHGIGGDGGGVHDFADIVFTRGGRPMVKDVQQSVSGIGRRGQDLCGPCAAVIGYGKKVREGTANVYANARQAVVRHVIG